MDGFREFEPQAIATSVPQAGVDKQLLDKLLVEAFAVSENAANKDIVLVIGNTGSGKSTTTNYLLGCPMEVRGRGAQDVIVVKPGAEEQAVIGHELTNSQTLYPSIFRMPENDYYLCDCPGFVDTRGLEYEISAALSTKMVINASRTIKNIVVVIPQGSIDGEARAAGLRSIFETLKKLLSQMHKAKQGIINLDHLKKAITFVITKPGFTITGRKTDTRKLLEQIRSERNHLKTEDSQNIVFMCDLMLSSNSLIEIDPLDDGESRIRLMNCFDQSIRLPPQNFCLPAAENAQRVLQDMLCEIASEGIALLTDLVNQSNIIFARTQEKISEKEEISNLQKKIDAVKARPYAVDHFLLPLKKECHVAEKENEEMLQAYEIFKNKLAAAKKRHYLLDKDFNKCEKELNRYKEIYQNAEEQIRKQTIYHNYNAIKIVNDPAYNQNESLCKKAKNNYDTCLSIYESLDQDRNEALFYHDEVLLPQQRILDSNYRKSQNYLREVQDRYHKKYTKSKILQLQSEEKEITLYKQQKDILNMKLYELNNDIASANLIFTKLKILLPNQLPHYFLLIKIATILGDSLRPETQQFLTLIHPVYAPVFIKILHQDIASNQNADAEFALAMCCQHGFGIVRNPENAVIYLNAAANHGHAEAQFLMGKLTEEQDALSSARFYQRASQQNHVKAQKRLGKFIDEQIAEALHNPYSQCFIGVCLEEGIYLKPDIVLAKKYYKNSAKQKFLPAMHRLGLLYECGKGVPLNILKAMRNYHSAAIHIDDAKYRLERLLGDLKRKAAANQARDQYLLSICYFEGIGVNQNHEERIKYLRWASDNKQPDPDAQFSLAKCYEHGEYTEKDALQALSYYKKSADGGNQFAQIALGRMVKSIIDLAKQGNSYAEYQLGFCYLEGYFVPIDYSESFRYFSASAKAIQQEHYHVAMYYIGWFYEHGKGGVTQNLLTAMEYYHFATNRVFSAKSRLEKLLTELKRNAAANRSDGQYLLSICYAKGIGVNKNPEEAFKYLKWAADNNHPEAQFFLAECYEEPARRDFLQALFYYKKSAENKNKVARIALKSLVKIIQQDAKEGVPLAEYQLGVCYHEGYYFDKKDNKSFNFFLAAASKDFAPAKFQVALCYENASGVTENKIEALRWYKAANQDGIATAGQRAQSLLASIHRMASGGNASAQYFLGICYDEGLGGLPIDRGLAKNWLRLSTKQKYAPAYERLSIFYAAGKAGNLDSNPSKKHQENSLKYMKKAKKYGSGSASFFLAEQREKGVGGVKQNSEKAKKHYQLANARHYPGAQDALGRFDESESSENSSEKCSIM